REKFAISVEGWAAPSGGRRCRRWFGASSWFDRLTTNGGGPIPFALSLSKGGLRAGAALASWFDRLTTNGGGPIPFVLSLSKGGLCVVSGSGGFSPVATTTANSRRSAPASSPG